MNLNRETLKNLISEAIKELSEEETPLKTEQEAMEGAPGEESKGLDLESQEKAIKNLLDKYLQGNGSALKTMVERATDQKGSRVKARILTVIADSFGISAEETRQDLATAGDQIRGK